LITEAEELRSWYISFIELFRTEYAKLSDNEKSHVPKTHNYNSKCQIEVFWLRQPNWQLIITSHFEDRLDMEITINGPYDSTVFQKNVTEIISQPKWNRSLYTETKNLPAGTSRLYSEFLANWFHQFIVNAKNAMFTEWKITEGFTQSVIMPESIIEHFFGNKGDFDHVAWVKKIIHDAKSQAEQSKIPTKAEESAPQVTYPKGFGAYFFPPIIIGKMLKPTLSDRIDGVKNIDFPTFDKKAFTVKFGQILIIVAKDGFIGVCINNKEKTIKVLNTIMAVCELEGTEATPVREHELSDIDYNPDTADITGFSYSNTTIRNELFHGAQKEKILEYGRKEIDEDYFKKIIDKAAEIFENEIKSERIRILLDALTFMKNSEFSQAFISGWKIIEQHISQKWKQEIQSDINTQNNSPDRIPTTENMINDLKSKDKITSSEYADYKFLKNIRNKDLHDGRKPAKVEAETCVNTAKKIVLLENSSV